MTTCEKSVIEVDIAMVRSKDDREERRKETHTVQLSKFLIRQLSEATRPARAVTFLDASGTNCGPREDEFPAIAAADAADLLLLP